jgi:hypothetical protein
LFGSLPTRSPAGQGVIWLLAYLLAGRNRHASPAGQGVIWLLAWLGVTNRNRRVPGALMTNLSRASRP